MCEPTTLAIAATVVASAGQLYQGAAANAQAHYEADVAQENRKHELAARDDAFRRGEIEQMRHYRQLSQRLGAQRASMAASGLDVNFGSAADLQTDTMLLGYEDSAIIAENTMREAKGYEINAANYTMQGRAARSRGKAALVGAGLSTASTILGGASQVQQMNLNKTLYGNQYGVGRPIGTGG